MLIFRGCRLKEHPTAVTATAARGSEGRREEGRNVESWCTKAQLRLLSVELLLTHTYTHTGRALLLASRVRSRMATINGTRIFWHEQNVTDVDSFQRIVEILKGNQTSCIPELVHVAGWIARAMWKERVRWWQLKNGRGETRILKYGDTRVILSFFALRTRDEFERNKLWESDIRINGWTWMEGRATRETSTVRARLHFLQTIYCLRRPTRWHLRSKRLLIRCPNVIWHFLRHDPPCKRCQGLLAQDFTIVKIT